ncbi:MAG: hypothetical protein ACPLRJ_02270 [Infirmifilum uzonense]
MIGGLSGTRRTCYESFNGSATGGSPGYSRAGRTGGRWTLTAGRCPLPGAQPTPGGVQGYAGLSG